MSVVFSDFPSGVLVYASGTDFTTWSGMPSPANINGLLRSASLLVRGATIASIYSTDANGIPSDGRVLAAFRDATCTQVAMWVAAGIDPVGGGVASSAPVRSKKLGSGSVDYDTSVNASVTAFTAKQAASRELCAEAYMILRQAGL